MWIWMFSFNLKWKGVVDKSLLQVYIYEFTNKMFLTHEFTLKTLQSVRYKFTFNFCFVDKKHNLHLIY